MDGSPIGSLIDGVGRRVSGVEGLAYRSNALSGKITSVLSASYADIEIRDALEVLDVRQLENTAETRRNLRRDVQKETIDANGEIVQDFGQVAEQLKTVGEALRNLQDTVASIRQHVTAARTETKPVLDEARTLVAHRTQVETKQHLLKAFNAHFLLTDEELKTLTSSGEPVDDSFFAVLVKAKRIHRDSQHLLGGENQRLGLEILDRSSRNLNSAFQKLYRYVHREFKTLDLENPRITASIRRSLRVLAERPTLFQSCLDAFAESRESTLSDMFYTALTGNNRMNSDHQKPIDFSAHEPLRYVGDMLAWAHSTAVSEREALEGLFISEGDEIARSIQAGLESEPWSRSEEDGSDGDAADNFSKEPKQEVFDGRRALSQLVNRSLVGVSHLLSSRVDNVIASHDDPVLAYKIANLLVFYRGIFVRLVNESGGFIETLDKLETTALDRFTTTMRSAVSTLESEEAESDVPDDLSPPEWLDHALENLSALLKSYETSLTTARHTTDPQNPQAGLQLIYTSALDPYMSLLHTLASSSYPPDSDQPQSLEATIFTLNSVQLILPTLTRFRTLTATKIEEMASQAALLSQSLIEDTHAFLLQTSGLAPLATITHQCTTLDPNDDIELTNQELLKTHFTPTVLQTVSEQLDAFLPSAVMDAEARLGNMRDKGLLGNVVREGGELFAMHFEGVEQVVERLAEAQGELGEEEESLRDLFPRTGEEVRVLLS